MAVRLSDEVKVSILVGDEEVVAVFPGYNNPEMDDAIKKLALGRTTIGRGGQAKDKSYEARTRFFNATCIRVENVEEGGVPLTPDVPDWRQKIPPNWKLSFALFFEEKATLSEDEVGN